MFWDDSNETLYGFSRSSYGILQIFECPKKKKIKIDNIETRSISHNEHTTMLACIKLLERLTVIFRRRAEKVRTEMDSGRHDRD